jgi:hypothetical protein
MVTINQRSVRDSRAAALQRHYPLMITGCVAAGKEIGSGGQRGAVGEARRGLEPNREKPREQRSVAPAGSRYPPSTTGLHRCAASPVERG